MSAALALQIDQGTSFGRLLSLVDGASIPIDITGYIFKGQVRYSFVKPEVLFSFTFSIRAQSGLNIGKVDMTLLPASTMAIVMNGPIPLVYDVTMLSTDGSMTRLFEGLIVLNPGVSR